MVRVIIHKTKPKPKAKGFYVQIIELLDDGTERIERELGPYANESQADKADDGVNRNMNHERFFTRQVQR